MKPRTPLEREFGPAAQQFFREFDREMGRVWALVALVIIIALNTTALLTW